MVDKVCICNPKDGRKLYVQVALTAMQEETRNREFGSLMQIKDNYPKYVVTLNDMILGNDYMGIRYLNLKDFLVEEVSVGRC